jgi:hypothetical protein
MRTTLDLDEDVLAAAKEIAAGRGTTMGKVVSELVRSALKPKKGPSIRNGIHLMPPSDGPIITLEEVNRLRDED